ncbi:MAG: OmpA family protein [Clostridia bacterium]|nr:OmpA family protein [Deltaproteobacteria bacterium]
MRTRWARWLPLLAVLTASGAHAAPASTAPTIDVNSIFQPSPGATSFITTESGEVNQSFQLSVGFNLNYARRPLSVKLVNPDDSTREIGAVINNRFDANLMGAFGIFDVADIGVVIPFTYQGGFEGDAINGAGIGNNDFPVSENGIEKFTLGDIRLIPKVNVLNKSDGAFAIAVLANVVVPTGNADFARENGLAVAPAVALSARNAVIRGGINLGYRIRGETQFSSLKVDDELFAKIAVGLNVGKLYKSRRTVELIGEVFGYTPADKPFYGNSKGVQREYEKARTTAEADLGLRIQMFEKLMLTFGGGGGLVRGYGAAQPRVYFGLMYYTGTYGVVDTDKDGVPDQHDKCTTKAEDKDGFQDDDGCPEVDNDDDNIVDDDDLCPNDPEDKDGYADDDGCPEADNDGDKVLDEADGCPKEQEDYDGFMDTDGCPDPDNDNDKVLDKDDQCPLVAEDRDGYQDLDGCPEDDNDSDGLKDLNDLCPNVAEDKDGVDDDDGCPEDNDKDGIADIEDKCPNQPETYNGFQDQDGCPDSGNSLVVVTEDKIEIKEKVSFDTGSAKIAKKSFPLLDQVASVLRSYKNITRVRIEGHTDNSGSARANTALSKLRANSVRAYLVGKGVDSSRLDAEGYGPDKPIASNATNKGREINRRVEFIIVEQKAFGKDVTEGQAKQIRGDDMEIEVPGGAITPRSKVVPAPPPAPVTESLRAPVPAAKPAPAEKPAPEAKPKNKKYR